MSLDTTLRSADRDYLVRWSRSGMGKRGGTRVIYYNTLSEGSIWLLIAYTKAKFDNLPAAFLKQLKEEISDGQ
jgi:hypothetical protein